MAAPPLQATSFLPLPPRSPAFWLRTNSSHSKASKTEDSITVEQNA